MIHLSQYQLIRLWSELEQAYFGKNGYGGDTAEIYAYTLHEHAPNLMSSPAKKGTFLGDLQKECYTNAANTLIQVLTLFEKERRCDIQINGVSIPEWEKLPELFHHRVRVTVTPKK